MLYLQFPLVKRVIIVPPSEIYCEALDLFMQKGYNGTSISMIAKALGMSKIQ